MIYKWIRSFNQWMWFCDVTMVSAYTNSIP
jgi:hypothetical protein